MKAWVHECRNCGKAIYFFYETWHHEDKRFAENAFSKSACSDDPNERYSGPQAEPVEGDALKVWFCNSTFAPRCSEDSPDPMGLGGHDSCQWVWLIPVGQTVSP